MIEQLVEDIEKCAGDPVAEFLLVVNYEQRLAAWVAQDSKRQQVLKQLFFDVFAKVRERSREGDSVAFSLTCLGKSPADHQIRWRAFANNRRCLILGPRDHGKSFVFAQWVPLEIIARQPNKRILIIRKTMTAARKTLTTIKNIVQYNTEFRHQWGNLVGKKWAESAIYTKFNTTIDPTIEVVGAGGSIVGNRADYIIIDDLIDVDSVETETRRKKIRDWFYGSVMEILEPDGKAIVIGTRKHARDLYGVLQTDDTEFMVMRDKAIDVDNIDSISHEFVYENQGGKEIIKDVTISGERAHVLWPDKWSLEKLLIKRANQGATLFARENQNEIVDDNDAIFKIDYLEQCRDYKATYLKDGIGNQLPWEIIQGRFVYVVQSWDLAVVSNKEEAEKIDSDYVVGATIGVTENGEKWLLNLVRDRGMNMTQRRGLIEKQFSLYRPVCVIIENNAFQNDFVSIMRTETGIPIIGHTSTGVGKRNYYTGIAAMAYGFENKKWVLPYESDYDKKMTNIMIQEFHGLGVEKHDDVLMAIWFFESRYGEFERKFKNR